MDNNLRKTIERMEKKILHLTLIKHWFDEIACGKKTREYREKKPYWTKRLKDKLFDEVWFKNGYGKNVPFMRVEWKGLKQEKGNYVISLGKILEIKN
jgi:hypothetical protein